MAFRFEKERNTISHLQKHSLNDLNQHDLSQLPAGFVKVEESGGAKSLTTADISVNDATTSSKGVVQVGDNLSVDEGVISSKPWAGHETSAASTDASDYQEGAIIETDEPVGDSADAVIAAVEHALTGSAAKVPASDAVLAYLQSREFLAAMAHAAMPSDVYETLTVPTSGGTVVAPADGYMCFFGATSAVDQYMALLKGASDFVNASRYVRQTNNSSFPAYALSVTMPVAAGDTIYVAYTATTCNLRFIYCNGSVPASQQQS